MSIKSFVLAGLGTLLVAAPVIAQTRGTMEIGGFGSAAMFQKELGMEGAYGGGGRIGMFLDRRWAIEFEKGEMRANRTNGLKAVNVGILSSRIVAFDRRWKSTTALIGIGGGVSTETNYLHSYGFDAMLGMKFAVNDRTAFRVDLVHDVLANYGWKSYSTIRMGLSWLRHPESAATK
jgi:hypothetical protein